MITHLRKCHGVVESSQEKPTVQLSLDKSFAVLKPERISQVDNAIAVFIVNSELPHSLSSSAAFHELLECLAPNYKPKSARTIKRRILEVYTVLRIILQDFFAKMKTKISITYDGWSNDSMKGFYSVTAHFTDIESKCVKTLLLDFSTLPPGAGIGGRLAEHLYETLCSFGVQRRLVAAVSDNGSDAVKAADFLSTIYTDISSGKQILRADHHIRCVVHSLQIGIKRAVEDIAPKILTLREYLTVIRSSKVKRENDLMLSHAGTRHIR